MLPRLLWFPQKKMLPEGTWVASDDEMTIDERRKYLTRMCPRYERANRAGRSELLSEMELVTGLHRKSLLRLLHAPSLERQPRTRQRGRTYGVEVERVVVKVWESLDFICAERLTPTLLTTARHLARFGALRLTEEVEAPLSEISEASEASVTRLLARHRTERLRLPRKGPERANSVTKDVPMRRIPWDTTEPGHCEVDLVHHAGASSAGEYAHTLQLVDVATGWSERVALPNRGQTAMAAALCAVFAQLPFPVLELHPDNGSEFFNAHTPISSGSTLHSSPVSASRAAVPTRRTTTGLSSRRTTTGLSSRRTTRWCASMWATSGSTRPRASRRWTRSTPTCASTTTSSSRSCASRRSSP